MSWQWIVLPGLAIIAALLFRRHVGFVVQARGHSMWPALRARQFLFSRAVLHGRDIRRGDIAVVQSPGLGRYIVKRVIGLPGDRLVLDATGLTRNGLSVAEPYVSSSGGGCGFWRVPEGHCFLMGDNRAASSDARSWEQPFTPLDRIAGRVAGGVDCRWLSSKGSAALRGVSAFQRLPGGSGLAAGPAAAAPCGWNRRTCSGRRTRPRPARDPLPHPRFARRSGSRRAVAR